MPSDGAEHTEHTLRGRTLKSWAITIGGLVLVFAITTGAAMLAFGGGSGQYTHQVDGQTPIMGSAKQPMQPVCDEAFGQEWDASGWVGGTPPVIACTGPNGKSGYVDMPQSLQDELNIKTVEETNGSE